MTACLDLTVRQAARTEAGLVSDILLEAAAWLQGRGTPMWRDRELLPERIGDDVSEGLYYLAAAAGEAAGTVKFQLSDPLFWPDAAEDAAYVHRLAVRRRFAGGAVSSALLGWAAGHAAALGRRFLRLDCEASRPRLRGVYERFSFRHHSNRQVGPYLVARYEYPIPTKSPYPRVKWRPAASVSAKSSPGQTIARILMPNRPQRHGMTDQALALRTPENFLVPRIVADAAPNAAKTVPRVFHRPDPQPPNPDGLLPRHQPVPGLV